MDRSQGRKMYISVIDATQYEVSEFVGTTGQRTSVYDNGGKVMHELGEGSKQLAQDGILERV